MRNDDLAGVRHMIEAAELALRFVAGRDRPDLDADHENSRTLRFTHHGFEENEAFLPPLAQRMPRLSEQ